MMSVRSTAIANENRSIDDSQRRALAARENEQVRPRSALEAMAMRLQVSADVLQKTLLKTVFAACRNNEEFVALVVVSNEYGLNPLLKEIYAFPTKGGGITPMVSVDGFIRLMNEHPAFDGIEFDYINNEKGQTEAIEAIIYRKDRTRPTKLIEYMDECKRNTDPWSKSPRRMLRHRALMQCVRVAFGFSGLAAEGDDEFENIPIHDAAPGTMPSKQTIAEELGDEIPSFDKDIGEVIEEAAAEPIEIDSRGMTEVNEETARKLDAGDQEDDEPNDGTLSEDNPTAVEGPADEQRGDQYAEEQDADFVGMGKPTGATRGQTWYNPDTGQLKYAHDKGDHGIKWYLQPQQDDSPAQSAAAEPSYLAGVRQIREKLAAAQTPKAVDGIDRDWCNTLRVQVEEADPGLVQSVERDIKARKRDLQAGGQG